MDSLDSLSIDSFPPIQCLAETSTTSSNTANIDNVETFSVFDDASCGEPFAAQRIRLDFTPNKEIDNDFVQNKCRAFWKFINGLPELQNLMVKPENNMNFKTPNGSYEASTSSLGDIEDKAMETKSKDLNEKTAVSTLEFVEDRGLIDKTFEAKIQESQCTMGSREYRELEKPKKKKKSICQICKCRVCACTPLEPSPLKVMVRDMQEWDARHPNAMTTASIEGITVNDSDKFSVFDGASCGEPFHAQQIHLDFTPNEEIDTDYVQKKCCAFWNFIHSLPELQNLRIMPEKNMDFKMSNKTDKASTSDLEDTATETQSGDLEEIEKENAVSVLKFANDKGLINRTFETKIKESHCTVGSREYRELEKPKKKKQSGLCKCRLCPFHPPEPSPLKVLVRSMQDWDAKHPKSMDGPSHPAPLHSCILQRKAECTCDTTHSDHSD